MKNFLTGILPDMLKESGCTSKYSKKLCMKRNKKSLFVVLMRDGIDVRGRQPCLLSHVDKVSMCWNDPLKQNVSHTQLRDCSNHLSAATTVALWAGLPHPGASGNSPPHTLQREAESSHSVRKLKSKQVPVACLFFLFTFLKINPRPLCSHLTQKIRSHCERLKGIHFSEMPQL